MSTEFFNIIIPEYALYIQVSDKRIKKYYRRDKGKKPAKTMESLIGTRYVWEKRSKDVAEFLYDTTTGEKVIANPKAQGTPRQLKINGQTLYVQSGGVHTRNLIMNTLHNFFRPFIIRQLPAEIVAPKGKFIQFEYIFYYPFCQEGYKDSQDYINHALPYMKAFEDMLGNNKFSYNENLNGLGVIIDDGPKYVRGGYARYVDIPEMKDRRLEIKIHFTANNEKIQ